MSTVEEKVLDASKSGGVGEVKALLRDNPGLNINWGDWRQFTALHWAANNGHAEVVKLLLAHPDISVNVTNSDGFTPFLLACQEGQVSRVERERRGMEGESYSKNKEQTPTQTQHRTRR